MLSIDKLFQALTAENAPPFPFTSETVSISSPEPAEGIGYNTKAIVSAKPDSGYYGSVPIYYTRVDLAELGTDVGLEAELPFTKESFLAALNTAKNTWLTEEELETVTLPFQEVGVVLTVPLRAKSEAFGWTGANTISILIGIPKEADALHQLLHTTMPGIGFW